MRDEKCKYLLDSIPIIYLRCFLQQCDLRQDDQRQDEELFIEIKSVLENRITLKYNFNEHSLGI